MANDERPALTDRQQKALDALGERPGDAGAVATALGITVSGAHSHVKALQKKGYITDDLKVIEYAKKGAVIRQPGDATTASSNGHHEAFALDGQVYAVVKAQKDSLTKTIDQILATSKVHQARLDEIETESQEHRRSLELLNVEAQRIENALAALS